MKRKINRLLSCILIAAAAMNPVTVFGSSLYEKVEQEQVLTSGVTYKKLSKLYPAGWMDVYVLEIDPRDPNVGFKVLESTQELGLKHNVLYLAQSNNALAAVNGDFFGSGSHMSSMGQVARNGEMEAAQNYYNGDSNKYAGFYLDTDSVPFIDYVKTAMGFYNLDNVNVEMGAKNKYTDFSKPVYYDRNAITTTASIDATRSDLSKIVVENGVIKDISGAGETVTVPENGFIIVMGPKSAASEMGKFSIGQTVGFSQRNEFVFRPNKDISSIRIGISGGGEILRNGEPVSSGLIIGENARNPRTVIGVNKDKSKVFIVCIDGRGDSIGATHSETADILLELGVYDAMHFDGGGSTTMVLKPENGKELEVVNDPSEGSMRQVANGFGVASVGESTGLSSLKLVLEGNENNIMFRNFGTAVTVYGRDNNLNSVDINTSNIEYSSTIKGHWNGNKFTPEETGTGTVTAKLGDAVGTLQIKVLEGADGLKLTSSSNRIGIGDSVSLNVQAINKDGFAIPASPSDIEWSVDNSSIATVDNNGILHASGEGTALVTAKYNDATASLSVGVGTKYAAVMSFEAARSMHTDYNNTDGSISGSSSLMRGVASDGNTSLAVNYSFAPSMTTSQAVYSVLDKPVPLPGNTSEIYLDSKATHTDKKIRVVVQDKNGKEYNVDLDTGEQWKKSRAQLPNDVAYPASITKIGVLALNTEEENVKGSAYIDNIGAVIGSVVTSYNTEFKDSANVSLSQPAPSGYEDITIFGQTASYSGDKTSLLSAMSNSARAMIFAGEANISNNTGVPSVIWENKYHTTDTDNFSVIDLATADGSLITNGNEQLRWLKSYINEMSNKNIIVVMDKDMTGNGETFTDSRQKEALKDIFRTAAVEKDKNILVISAVGNTNTVKAEDGVRYANLAGYSSASPAYLRVRGNSSDLQYEIVNLQ